ncbi:MAG: HPP family protein [Haloferacaceae archaeon]
MEDIFAARIMSTDLHTVSPDTLVEEAAQVLLDNDIGAVPVVDGENRLVGILTTTDFVTIVANSEPKAETTVARYMTTDVVTADPQETIVTVATTMLEGGFHHVPVVDEVKGLIGIVSTTDLAAYLSDAQSASIR